MTRDIEISYRTKDGHQFELRADRGVQDVGSITRKPIDATLPGTGLLIATEDVTEKQVIIELDRGAVLGIIDILQLGADVMGSRDVRNDKKA